MKITFNFTILILTLLLSGCFIVKHEPQVSTIPQEPISGYVNKDFLEVYSFTNNQKPVTYIPRGTKILIVDTQGDLVNISNNPRYPSWVKADYICFTENCWINNKSIANGKTKENISKSTNKNQPQKKSQKNNETSIPPSGATAKCKDGSLSFSKSRRGTCSRHGGVSVWY